MKKHKHAELIKAWADGAEIEARAYVEGGWSTWTGTDTPTWNGTALTYEFRIKPKPDHKERFTAWRHLAVQYGKPDFQWNDPSYFAEIGDVEVTYDGVTNKIKSVELLK